MNGSNGHGAALATQPRELSLQWTKAVILADSVSRFSGGREPQLTTLTEIGGKPLVWHLLMSLRGSGVNQFVVVLSDDAEPLKRYLSYYGSLWNIHVVELPRGHNPEGLVRSLGEEPFLLLDGRSLSDIDLRALLEFHAKQGCLVTAAVVRPPARFGALGMDGDQVVDFSEKPALSEDWHGSGVYLIEPDALAGAAGLSEWQETGLDRLARAGEVAAFQHNGYWQALETLRDQQKADEQWQSGHAPWKTWR